MEKLIDHFSYYVEWLEEELDGVECDLKEARLEARLEEARALLESLPAMEAKQRIALALEKQRGQDEADHAYAAGYRDGERMGYSDGYDHGWSDASEATGGASL